MSMRMQWGFTMNWKTWVSKRVAKITKSPYSHVVIIFSTDEDEIYFESFYKADKQTSKKNGVRGPMPLSDLEEWVAEDPDERQLNIYPQVGYLPLTDHEVEAAYTELCKAVHHVYYAPVQIGLNLIAARLGWYLKRRRGSTDKWTCSETCVRILPPRVWGYFGLQNYNADDFAPAGTVLPSVLDRTRVWLANERALRP
jgi:hypothetical protein